MRNLPRNELPPRTSDAAIRDERRRLREPPEPSSFHQFAQTSVDDDAGGRFGKREGAQSKVTGTAPAQQWPELPPSSPGTDPTPDEPSLGYSINDLNPSPDPAGRFKPLASRAPGGAEAPSTVSPRSVDDVEREGDHHG